MARRYSTREQRRAEETSRGSRAASAAGRSRAASKATEGPKRSIPNTRTRSQQTLRPMTDKDRQRIEAAKRKRRGMQRSTARSVGRAVSPATTRAASSAASRKSAAASSGRTTTSVKHAERWRTFANAATRIPGIQDRNSEANKNLRRANTRVVQGARARVAAETGGTQRARSAQTREANRTRRGPRQTRNRELMAQGKKRTTATRSYPFRKK